MKKIKIRLAGIMISIIFILFDWTLHLHHSEEIRDQITIRFEKLFQTYYGEAIGGDWL
jgi:hypothetical protein